MNSLSIRKIVLLILVCATVGVLLWLWFDQEKIWPGAARTTSESKTTFHAKVNEKAGSQTRDLSGLRLTTIDRQVPRQVSMDANSLGPFHENARSLVRSGSLGKVDYGLFQARNGCISFFHAGSDGPKALKEFGTATPRQQGGTIGLGSASEATRLVAFQRSVERCTKLFDGAAFKEEEYAAFSNLPSVVKYRSILSTLGNAKDFSNPETMAALSTAVTEPMFGALAALLVNKIDYSDMVAEYGSEMVMPLYALTVPLVLCRMGDDCGPGGIIAEQLCWLNRICGDPVEDAIWSTLRAQGVDTRVMEQFVTRVHLGLQNRDPTIFRKPK